MTAKPIVVYPVIDPPGGGEVYESLPLDIDGIPGCIYSVTRKV